DAARDAIEDRHDLFGAEVGVQEVERYRAAECPVGRLQPAPCLGLGSQYVLGRRGHASHAEQPVRLVRPEASLLLPARQCALRKTDHTGQRGQGDPVAFRNRRQRGIGQLLSGPTSDGGVVGRSLPERVSVPDGFRDHHDGDHGASFKWRGSVPLHGKRVNVYRRRRGFSASFRPSPTRLMASTMMGARQLGRMWRKMMRASGIPSPMQAWTKSRRRMPRNSPRTSRATAGQDTTVMAITVLESDEPSTATRTMAKRKAGMVWKNS